MPAVSARVSLRLLLFLLVVAAVLVLPHPTAQARPAPASLAVAGLPVNASKHFGVQNEPSIAVNPTNPQNLVATSNTVGGGFGIWRGYSFDGGATWTGGLIATGVDLPAGCCDGELAFDGFGNLFFTYINNDAVLGVEVALSTDGGVTFTVIKEFHSACVATIPATRPAGPPPKAGLRPRGSAAPQATRGACTGLDQPKVATGAGAVWISVSDFDAADMIAAGAPVTGRGQVGAWVPTQALPGSAVGDFGGMAIGPGGQVYVVYQNAGSGAGPDIIRGNLKADGLGPGSWGAVSVVTPTNVGGFFPIPAQPNRTIDAEAHLSWDRSDGPHRGRLYLSYTDSPALGSTDTNIFVRYSDDNGVNWSAPVRVNDDGGSNSQFMPRAVVDQLTGAVYISWYDCRNDLGLGGPGDIDGTANDDAEFWASFSRDGGVSWAANVQVSARASSANAADTADAGSGIEYGDYSFIDGYGGAFYPVWMDNTNSTGDNPNGAFGSLNVYTARVILPSVPTSAFPASVPASASAPTAAAGVLGTMQAFTLAARGCGTTTPPPGAVFANGVSNVIVTAIPCPGSRFTGWTNGPCAGTTINPCDISPMAGTVTANFTP